MPGPPSPQTPSETHKLAAPPKISGTDPTYVGLHPASVAGEAAAAAAAAPGFRNYIHGPWVELMTAIGVSGPAHITGAKGAIHALGRYGGARG